MMLAALGVMAMLWALGNFLRWPTAVTWAALGLVYFATLTMLIALPEESAAAWAILGGMAALVGAYIAGLRWVKARVPLEATVPQNSFRDAELERYARHIVLREVGGAGQKKLKQAKVLVVGAGGLGSPVLMYLAAAGVGAIGIIDDDDVDHTNMQRQVIHRDQTIGQPKVHSAAEAMRALNPYIEVRPFARRLSADIVEELIADFDIVIDGTDNFNTRYLVNRAASKLGKPLISGALAQWEGQLSVFDPSTTGPCYECIFPEEPAAGLAPSCAEAGVIGPLPGVVGTMMALEAVKLITGAGHVMRGEMLIYDGLYGESRKIKLARRTDCAACKDI